MKKYKSAKTLSEALSLGAWRGDLYNDGERGYWTLDDPSQGKSMPSDIEANFTSTAKSDRGLRMSESMVAESREIWNLKVKT